MKMNINKIVATLFIIAFVFPTASYAASIYLVTENNNVGANKDFLIEVLVDTESDSINAIGGKVIFSADTLELKEIRDGNSQINFWVEKPFVSKPGEISFSGITPGGLSGKDKHLFSIVLSPKTEGNTSVYLGDIEMLKNDGLGTKINATTTALSLLVSTNGSSGGVSDIDDKEKPEDFLPIIGSDPEIYSGKYFLVFTTQDKASGVDHYEVKEGMWSKYIVATSPYLLSDQSLSSTIYVKAVDKKGNERIVKLSSKNTPLLYEILLIIGIILAVCIIVFRKRWQKST